MESRPERELESDESGERHGWVLSNQTRSQHIPSAPEVDDNIIELLDVVAKESRGRLRNSV